MRSNQNQKSYEQHPKRPINFMNALNEIDDYNQ